MKTMRTLIKKASALIIIALVTMLPSCIQEDLSGSGSIKTDGEATVTMMIDLPKGSLSATKAMTNAQEGDVKEVNVLVFGPNGGGFKFQTLGYDINTESDSKKTFKAKLQTGNFDLMILGNSSKAFNELTNNSSLVGKTRAEVEALLIEKTTEKWDADGSRPFPMWGMTENLTITADLSLTGSKAIKLNRMNARIDVIIENTAAFVLTSVHIYNWNNEGQIVPNQSTEAWDKSVPKAKLPTIPTSSIKDADNPLIYKDAEITAKGTEREIYIFEALNLKANNVDPLPLTDRTCLVIGGKYQDGEPSYYRVDFANKVSDKWVYLNVLRNHHYTVGITEVKGNGHATPEEAFKSEPINIEANVVEWNDGGMGEVVFDGQNYLSISSRNSHFDQFGNTETTTITIKSNLTELKFSDFINTTTVGDDGAWKESPSGTWSNNHFTVKIAGSRGEYTLTFEAKPTASGEAQRKSTFKVSAGRLSASISLSQDEHMKYRLITSPNPEHALMVGDKLHRFPIHVTSTHDYMIIFGNTETANAMITEAYTAETGGSKLEITNISKDITTVWIEVANYFDTGNQEKPRLSTAEIKHVDEESSAASAIYNIIQARKQLEASITGTGGKLEMPMGKKGGSLPISVISNLPLWEATVKLNNKFVTTTDYLSKATGSGIGNLTFTVPANETDKVNVFIISFKEKTSSSDPLRTKDITITQRSPNAVRAEKNILSLDDDGILNLDGRGEIVLFKHGSLLAITSDAGVGAQNQLVVWRPDEFTSIITKFNDIPSSSGEIGAINKAVGTGDPCELVEKDGQAGIYRMATREDYDVDIAGNNYGIYENHNGAWGRWYKKGTTAAQFYPWANERNASGVVKQADQKKPTIHYRSSTPGTGGSNTVYALKIEDNKVSMHGGYTKVNAAPIRCIKK